MLFMFMWVAHRVNGLHCFHYLHLPKAGLTTYGYGYRPVTK